ncbi:hypothetical protein WJX84_007285 [Apatococcus fuscideae]|uniref:Uncharacterized protein n=1 Tax=Apatococcus fuscideae TaxID=2026836 RepID=A0AAW1T806_9CHLO
MPRRAVPLKTWASLLVAPTVIFFLVIRAQQMSWTAQRRAADEQQAALEAHIASLSLEVQQQSAQVAQLTEQLQLQLTRMQPEKRSLQEGQSRLAANCSQAGCAEVLQRCGGPVGAEGLAWRRDVSRIGGQAAGSQNAEGTRATGHKLAVLVPYRDRPAQLDAMLPALDAFLQNQARDFGIFIIEQTPELRFNRGALLNAGFLLLAGSDYDYFAFQDVDTVPTEAGNIQYEYPSGMVPLHLTPVGIHPNARYEDFFGGIVIFTREQMLAVNGFGVNFWGWGREDDNMRLRLIAAGRWPPQRPSLPLKRRGFYFKHARHDKAPEVRMRTQADGTEEVVEEHPDLPYDVLHSDAKRRRVLGDEDARDGCAHERPTGCQWGPFQGEPPSQITTRGPRIPKALPDLDLNREASSQGCLNMSDSYSPAPTADCFAPGPGSEDLLGLRLGGLFGILAVSTIGVSIPFFTYTAKLETLFFFLRAFASGVVLTTGYVHVLGDAYPILTDPCLGLSTTYPWAMTFATAASLFTFTLEWCLHKQFHKRLNERGPSPKDAVSDMRLDMHQHGKKAQYGSEDAEAMGTSHSFEDMPGSQTIIDSEEEKRHTMNRLKNLVHSYTFETGIIFHSIFIGITLGVSQNRDTVTALMIALFFHQGNEGLALGVLFVKAGYSRLRYLILGFLFVVVTPLGVAIGIGVSSTYNGESKAALGTEGVFDSISAGILIYNGLVDLILPTFEPAEMPKKWWLQVVGFGSLYSGAAIMALIAKWA